MPLEDEIVVPEDCLKELKSYIISVITCWQLKALQSALFKRLLRITAWVMKFIEILKLRGEPNASNSLDINRAEVYWIIIIQQALVKDEQFNNWTCLRRSKDSGDAEGDWERLIFLRIQDIQFCCMESTISHC